MGARHSMDPVDQLLLRQESDPRRRSAVTLVLRLDRVPDPDILEARLASAARQEPRLRQRIVRPWHDLGPPQWVVERDFDVLKHLTRRALPAPGSDDQLMDVIESIADQDIDYALPPWQLTVVDQLAGGGAALVARVSHVLTDGLAGMQLLAGLVDVDGRPAVSFEGDRDAAGAQPIGPGKQLNAGRLAAENVLSAPIRAQLRYWRNYAVTVRATAAVAHHPRRRIGQAASYARSLLRVAAPLSAAPSFAERGAARRFFLVEVPAEDLRRAARSAGGSLNDGYLAAVIGGLRRYHEGKGLRPDHVPFAIPISTRSGSENRAGNRLAGVRFPAPVGVVDPAARIARIHEIVRTARAEPALDALTTLAPALVQLPDRVLGLAGRAQDHLDMQASYVPGPPIRVGLAGTTVESMFAFGPLPGPAVMSVLLTYAGVARIGFTVDADAVADVDALKHAMRGGFEEVLALSSETDGAA